MAFETGDETIHVTVEVGIEPHRDAKIMAETVLSVVKVRHRQAKDKGHLQELTTDASLRLHTALLPQSIFLTKKCSK